MKKQNHLKAYKKKKHTKLNKLPISSNNLSNNIVNLSTYHLSSHETTILGKGLSFIPKPKHVDTDDIVEGIAKLKAQMISKAEKKQKITLSSTIPDDYNPWQTIRVFNPKNNAGQTNETQNQILKNFITNTSDGIEKILPRNHGTT